jgi:Icc-related predicted phosphoesterase
VAPEVFLIPGNDDPRAEEPALLEGERLGAWRYLQGRRTDWEGHPLFGYGYVPPTPFRMKDWERYDVSHFTDPGCIPPEEGWRSVHVAEREARLATIAEDLTRLAGDAPLENAVFLFHSPPYRTSLDRAALDGKAVDYAPLDVHVGSVAIRRFIEERQPLLTLHGHIHESVRMTGTFLDRIGRTVCLTGAHDGPELALVTFTLEAPGEATRELI